jgi:hypothetical protein
MCHSFMTTTLSKTTIPLQKLPVGTCYILERQKRTHEVDAINVKRDDAISGGVMGSMVAFHWVVKDGRYAQEPGILLYYRHVYTKQLVALGNGVIVWVYKTALLPTQWRTHDQQLEHADLAD